MRYTAADRAHAVYLSAAYLDNLAWEFSKESRRPIKTLANRFQVYLIG